MSIKIPSRYTDVENQYSRTNVGSSPSKIHNRRYNVKKTDTIQDHYNNQNNKWVNESPNENYRSRTIAVSGQNDMKSKYRYKSYDYLPVKYGATYQLKESRHTDKNSGQDFVNSADYLLDYSRNQNQHNHRQNLASTRQCSSNEELENSNGNELSSEYSRKNSFKASNQNYGSCLDNKQCKDYRKNENGKAVSNQRKYNTSTYYNPPLQQPKRSSFSNNYSNSVDKNCCGTLTKMISAPTLHSDETNYSHCVDVGNENYVDCCDDNHNKNPMSLKSSYRKDENIPHSGTRLEYHRKQMDKFCRGNLKAGDTNNRFNESNNCERICQYSNQTVSRPNHLNRCTLPTPPKHNHHNKPSVKDHKHYSSKLGTANRHSNEGLSDNDSYYFDSCRNSNNDYLSKPQEDDGYYCDSGSDHSISSSSPLSDGKPTETLPISLISPKIKASINPQIPSLCQEPRTNNCHSQRKFSTKQTQMTHRHSCRSRRHRSSHKHN